jgi:hypothetical protein
MVGGDDDIGRLGEAEIGKRLAEAMKIIVCVLDGGEGSRAISKREDRPV